MVRIMISKKKLPKTFWPKVVNWTVHILNRSPKMAVKNKTLEETWSGVKPLVEHFRVFGCISHVHVLDNKRTKLDDKSLSCVCWELVRSPRLTGSMIQFHKES